MTTPDLATPAPVIPRAYRVAERMVAMLYDASGHLVCQTPDGIAARRATLATHPFDSHETFSAIRTALLVARSRAEASVPEDT